MLVCTLSALSSFGPVVALANLGASRLTQVFASADRVLDLLDEDPRDCRCDRRRGYRLYRCTG